MELFNLLKNKAGKLVMGGTQVAVLTVGVAGLFSSAMFKVGESIGENELAVRPLSSVSSSYAYEGLNRKSDGTLSSMNIQNRGVAVGTDRERLEGNSSKNDFGLSAADNLGRRVSVPGTGSAAASSATDGLGSGGVDMVEINYGASSSRASVPGINPGAVSQGAYGGAQQAGGASAGEGSGGKLASASMARASGNAFNAAAGSVASSSSSAASGRGGAASRASGSEGYNFSGSMPSGSNVVSAYNGLNGSRMSGSSFMAGGRNATVGRRGGSSNGKDDLKKISKMSADVAKDRNRGAASGARPFLANSATSAGMSMDAEAVETTAGSADFETPESRNLKAIGDWGQQADDQAEQREADRKRLMWMLIGTVAATALAIPFGYKLITEGKATVPVPNYVQIIAGCLILATAAALASTLLAFAGKYAHDYSGGFASTISGIVGGVSIVALALTAAYAFAGKKMPFNDWVKKIMPSMEKGVLSAGKGLGKTAALGMAKEEISKQWKS